MSVWFCQASVCSLVFVSSQQGFGVTDIKSPPRRVTALGSWTDRVIALREISVTALFYLEDSRPNHLPGMRARWSKDPEKSAPAHRTRGGGGWVGERESSLVPLFMFFFLPPGRVLYKLGLGRSAVPPEVLTSVLGPYFVLFLWAFPFPCVSATAILDSFSLF